MPLFELGAVTLNCKYYFYDQYLKKKLLVRNRKNSFSGRLILNFSQYIENYFQFLIYSSE